MPMSLSYNFFTRQALPRATSGTNTGVALTAVGLVYSVTSGTVSSITPSVTRFTYADAGIETSASVTLSAASPAYTLTTNATAVRRGKSAVTTVTYDSGTAASTSVEYLIAFSVVVAATATISLYGMDVYYDQNSSAPLVTSATTITTSTTLSTVFAYGGGNAQQGSVIPVDTSAGAVVLTLPAISTGNAASGPGASVTIRVAVAGNALRIAPNVAAPDQIVGLGLNTTPTTNTANAGRMILATPNVGDYIKIQSNGTAIGTWFVLEAVGVWTFGA
jgi:hypothetical protein